MFKKRKNLKRPKLVFSRKPNLKTEEPGYKYRVKHSDMVLGWVVEGNTRIYDPEIGWLPNWCFQPSKKLTNWHLLDVYSLTQIRDFIDKTNKRRTEVLRRKEERRKKRLACA